MFVCAECKRSFESIKALLNHLRFLCFNVQMSSYKCGQEGCQRHFCSLASLRKHLRKYHNNLELACNNVAQIESSHGQNIIDNDTVTTTTSKNIIEFTDLSRQTELFVSNLYSSSLIPRSNVQEVLESVQLLTNSVVSHLESQVSALVIGTNDTNVNLVTPLHNVFGNVTNLFEKFQSEYKRLQYFENLGTYVPPVQVIVGQHMEQKRTKMGLTYMPTDCTMQIIPLNRVLTNFFSNTTILQDTLAYQKSLNECNSTAIVNFIQGSVWAKIINDHATNDNNELLLPLLVYYDDFETGNPLGSHAGIHKLGGVYVTCPCLPPKYASQLNQIFILALFHSSDRTKFGNRIIFKRVIEELNLLSKVGINLNTEIFKGVIKFRVGAITGDNLGLNAMLGFVESFSANHPCRICLADRHQIQTMTVEDSSLLRNETNYKLSLDSIDTYESGIKEQCVWYNLEGFNLFNNVAVDLLHDMLEGCCRYVMKFIISYFIKDLKLLHINTILQRIAAFDFGPDSGSKPTTALMYEGNILKIKMSASEMLTFVRYFGLLVGYYIPRENEVWTLYILLRTILERLLSHRVYSDTCDQLSGLICEFNEKYRDLSKEPLKPKFHFLLHYPEMLKKFGPVTNIWSMRFEAKHSVAKKISHSFTNRRNITKSIAIKHQLLLNDMFLRNSINLCLQFGKKKVVSLELSTQLKQKFNLSAERRVEFSVSWVKVNGIIFRRSANITTDLSQDTFLPSFAKINDIFLDDQNKILFSCLVLDTVYFDEHYFTYKVIVTDKPLYISYDDLIAPIPNAMNVMPDLSTYVTLRWTLD